MFDQVGACLEAAVSDPSTAQTPAFIEQYLTGPPGPPGCEADPGVNCTQSRLVELLPGDTCGLLFFITGFANTLTPFISQTAPSLATPSFTTEEQYQQGLNQAQAGGPPVSWGLKGDAGLRP